jgi:hypothetical protein
VGQWFVLTRVVRAGGGRDAVVAVATRRRGAPSASRAGGQRARDGMARHQGDVRTTSDRWRPTATRLGGLSGAAGSGNHGGEVHARVQHPTTIWGEIPESWGRREWGTTSGWDRPRGSGAGAGGEFGRSGRVGGSDLERLRKDFLITLFILRKGNKA